MQRAGQGDLDLACPPEQAEGRAGGQLYGHVLDDAASVRGDGHDHRAVSLRRALGPGRRPHRESWSDAQRAVGHHAEGHRPPRLGVRGRGGAGGGGPPGREQRGHQPGEQDGGQEGADGLHPARATRVGHASPGHHGHQAPGDRGQPGHRVDAVAEAPASGQAGVRPAPTVTVSGRTPREGHARTEGHRARPRPRPAPHGDRRRSGPPPRRRRRRRCRWWRLTRATPTVRRGVRPAHVGGTGVSARIRPTRAGPSPPLPSAMSRWARQATATAWTSWGVT